MKEDFLPAMRVLGALFALSIMVSVVLQIVGLDPARATIFGFIVSSFLMTKPSE